MNVAVVLSGVATVAWLVAIGVIGLAVYRATRGEAFEKYSILLFVENRVLCTRLQTQRLNH